MEGLRRRHTYGAAPPARAVCRAVHGSGPPRLPGEAAVAHRQVLRDPARGRQGRQWRVHGGGELPPLAGGRQGNGAAEGGCGRRGVLRAGELLGVHWAVSITGAVNSHPDGVVPTTAVTCLTLKMQ